MIDVDYDRDVTFLALRSDGSLAAAATMKGDADGEEATVAISVREDCKGRGVSWTLLEHTLRYAKAQGIRSVKAVQSAEDLKAVQLEREMGFAVTAAPADEDLTLTFAIA